MEGAPTPDLAVYPEVPAHQLHQPGRDGQSQPGSAVPLYRGAFGLLEHFEDGPLLLLRDADARVRHRKVEHHFLFIIRR